MCSYLVLHPLHHLPPHPPQAEDGSCTAMEYDTAKAKETRTQLLMGGLICVGVHYKWGYMQVPRRSPARRRVVPMPPSHPTRHPPVRHAASAHVHAFHCSRHCPHRARPCLQPLLMTCVMNLFHIYDCKPLHIHLLGKKVERPWAAPAAANPLQQWAEKKKAEAEAAAAKAESEAKKRN